MKKELPNDGVIPYLKQVDQLRFLDIRLMESATKFPPLRGGELPTNAAQKMEVHAKLLHDEQIATGIVTYHLEIAYADPRPKELPVLVSAKYAVQYSILDDATADGFEETVSKMATIASWAFWREFVSSMTTRMGLPAFPIPILSISHLNKSLEEKKKKATLESEKPKRKKIASKKR